MKFGKNKLAVALGAALAMGAVGQASASVYGVSHLNIDGLTIAATKAGGGLAAGGAGLYTFDLDKNAVLNGTPDASAANALCFGDFSDSSTTCTPPPRILENPPVLDSAVQNVGVPVRAQSDYSVFGKASEYSNANNVIHTATLLTDPDTHVESISNANLITGSTAQASSNLGSNTNLSLQFAAGGGAAGDKLTISFVADIYMETSVDGGDIGIAQSASGATFVLQKGGVTLVSWAPNGLGAVATCAGGLVCTATDPLSLNNTSSSNGTPNILTGSNAYSITIDNMVDGDYTLALNSTTSTTLIRKVPVPGTLLLVGTGLLMGARATRRKK